MGKLRNRELAATGVIGKQGAEVFRLYPSIHLCKLYGIGVRCWILLVIRALLMGERL